MVTTKMYQTFLTDLSVCA